MLFRSGTPANSPLRAALSAQAIFNPSGVSARAPLPTTAASPSGDLDESPARQGFATVDAVPNVQAQRRRPTRTQLGVSGLSRLFMN